MLLNFAIICFGCWPPPPPPEPEPDPLCEGTIARVVATTGQIVSKTSGSVTFTLPNCRANYVFVGPGGQTTVFVNVSRAVTATFSPSRVSLNDSDDLRLYLASNPTNFAQFRMTRSEINDLDPGITTGYYFFSSGGGGYVLIPFNQTLYERYERLVLSWNLGTLRKVWVGESFATLQANLGGALPTNISLWNVTHRFFRGGLPHLQKSMVEGAPGPIIQPTGPFEFRETSSSFTYNYGESVDGNATTTAISLSSNNSLGTGLILVTNVQPTTVRITN